jgi:hypothetical protein
LTFFVILPLPFQRDLQVGHFRHLGESKYSLIIRDCPMTSTLLVHEGQIKEGVEEYRHCGLTVEAIDPMDDIIS